MGMVFSNVLHFPDLWALFSAKIHLFVSCFGISGFMGMIFRIFFRFMGILFEKFLRIYGWYFCDLNGTTSYLGNSSDPPPSRE